MASTKTGKKSSTRATSGGIQSRVDRLTGVAPEPEQEQDSGVESRVDRLLGLSQRKEKPSPTPTDKTLDSGAESGSTPTPRPRSLFDRQMDIIDPSRRAKEGQEKDKPRDPSFARDVVWKTATDVVETPDHLVKGLGVGMRNFASSAEGYIEAELRRLDQQIQELEDEDYVVPWAKKMYPLEFNMPEEVRQKRIQRRKETTRAYKRTEEAMGGVEAKQERMNRLKDNLEGVRRAKEIFPEQNYEEADNFVHLALQSLGQFAPSMAATAGGGLPIGLASYYMQFKGSMYESMVKQGIPKDRAHDGARVGAALTSVIGVGGASVSISALSRVLPAAIRGTGANPAIVDKTRRALEAASKREKLTQSAKEVKDFVTPSAAEWVSEYLEQYPEAFGQVVAQSPKDASGDELLDSFQSYVQTDEFAKNQIMSANVAGLAGLFMPLGVASVGTAYRRYQMPGKQFDVEGARGARDRLTDAYQRIEGDMGLASDHMLAQYNMDLYNRLNRPEGSIFDQMKAKAQMKAMREAKTIKRATEILEGRGQTLKVKEGAVEKATSEETRQETSDTLDKIRPKREKPETVAEPEVTPEEAAPTTEAEARVETSTQTETVASVEGDVLTKQGSPFKSQAAAKSKRTRQGMQDTHEVVKVKDGYALRPVEQETVAEAETVAETTEAEAEGNVFEDLEILLEEQAKIEAGESDMSPAELAPILENVQNETIKYLEDLDPTERAAFVAGNLELTREKTRQLEGLLNKEATEGITTEQNAIKNSLIRKMVGKQEITQEYLDNKGKLAEVEQDGDIELLPSYFDSDPESVSTIHYMFSQKRPDQIRENPETMLGYLVNQVNAWVHGVGDADVNRIRDTLQEIRANSDELYSYFANQVHLNDFIEGVDQAIELAERANELKSGGSAGPMLKISTGLDLFYPAVRDIIAKVESFRGKMQARDALNKLKKTPGIKAADLEFTGLDRYLNRAAMNNERVTKEGLLEAAEKMPNVEVTILATDKVTEVPRKYKDLVRTREGIVRLGEDFGVVPDDFIRAEAERLIGVLDPPTGIALATEAVEGYLRGEYPFRTVADIMGDYEASRATLRNSPAYIDYSKVAQNDQYEYEEILIRIPSYSPDPSDMHHAAFGRPVSFFARIARNKDMMLVEEIQSEIATMGASMKGKPYPFKTDGWPNLITSLIAKRAKELGYKEVYMPTYEWVNQRWQGHLPKSTKPVYEKIVPAAMERLGAKRLDDTVVEDAKLRQDNDMATRASVRLDTVLFAADDLSAALVEMDSRYPDMKAGEIEGAKAILNDLVIPPPDMPRSRGESRAGYISDQISKATDWAELGYIVSDQAEFFNEGIQERVIPGAGPFVDTLGELSRQFTSITETMLDLDMPDGAMDKVSEAINKSVGGPMEARENTLASARETAGEIVDRYVPSITGAPFQRYQLPAKEIEPGSIPVTLNMGFDPTNVYRLAKRAAGKLTNKAKKPDPKAKGQTVADMYKGVRDDTEKSLKQQRKEIENLLRVGLIDTTSPMKNMIKETFGEVQSREMINRIILAKGHGVRANAFLNRAIKDIYGKLGARKREILDEVIFSSRLIQIGRYKQNTRDFKGRTPQQHRDFLNNLEDIYGLTEREALDLFRRAELYFDRTLNLLDVLQENGLISKEEYDELKTFRWTRTEALKKIDPDVDKGFFSMGHRDVTRRQQAKTKDSGIQELELGSELDTPNIDMAYVLADWTQRVMKRSALARMNESLWDLANSEQKNELVKPAKGTKRPADWVSSQIIVRGKKRKIYVHPQFAKYWQMDTAEISPAFANAMRIVSGSVILRPMATGVRLGFIPVNIARDMVLQQYSAKYLDNDGKWKSTWNSFMPLGIGQQLYHMGSVAPAAIFRGKKYQQFADTGGSLLFMGVQGKPLEAGDMRTRFGRGAAARTAQFQHSADRVMDSLGYLNVTSEILTRLSLVERSLIKIAQREGVSKEEARNTKKLYEEAAANARDYLDFGQSGSMVKAVDSFRPYTNAALQAGRAMVRSWKRDWKHAALQSAQIATIGSLLALGKARYMHEEDEEGVTRDINRDIPARDLARFFTIFPFGKHMYFEDEYGEKHRPYFKIPVDGLLIPPKLLGEVAMARMTGNEIRGDVIREGVKAAIEPYGFGGGIGIPTLDAYFNLVHDMDLFFGGKVWPYDDLIKAEERITRDTPQFIRDMAEFMNKMPGANVSPYQLHHASKSIGAGGTWFTHYMGQAYDHFRDVPQSSRELILWEAIADHPTTGGLINYTRPDVARYEEMESWEKEQVTEMKKHDLYVTRQLEQAREDVGGKLDDSRKSIRTMRKMSDYIENNAKDADHRKRLYEIIDFYAKMPNTPRFGQWSSLAGKRPETKARYIKQMYQDAGPDEKRKIMNEARMFPHVDSDAVWREFDRLTEKEIFRE